MNKAGEVGAHTRWEDGEGKASYLGAGWKVESKWYFLQLAKRELLCNIIILKTDS